MSSHEESQIEQSPQSPIETYETIEELQSCEELELLVESKSIEDEAPEVHTPQETQVDSGDTTMTSSLASETPSELTPVTENESENHNEEVESEQASVKSNRELKSILELSKEANLDTNIVHKRKSIDPSKGFDSDGSETPAKKMMGRKSRLKSVEARQVESSEEKPARVARKRKSMFGRVVGTADEKKNKKEDVLDLTPIKRNKDAFCWRCHKSGIGISCETCPRSFHLKCIRNTNNTPWQCPECITVLKAENVKTRSPSLKSMDLDHLCVLLKYALKRMMKTSECDPFLHPVNETDFPDYKKYIVQPMDLTKIEKNLQNNLYGSTNAFEADTKWILHNSIIFNAYIFSDHSKLTSIAKWIVKTCKQEMFEIENCASCYQNANTKENWFTEICPKPHLLLWAKLKGFPYWPAKAMSTNNMGMVDVRFFGAHDRAWVGHKDCYLYSQKNPNSNQVKRNDINECIKEVDVYVENLKKMYGVFNYAPYKTPFNPEVENLTVYLPKYVPSTNDKRPLRYRTESKSSLMSSSSKSASTSKLLDNSKNSEMDYSEEDSRDLDFAEVDSIATNDDKLEKDDKDVDDFASKTSNNSIDTPKSSKVAVKVKESDIISKSEKVDVDNVKKVEDTKKSEDKEEVIVKPDIKENKDTTAELPVPPLVPISKNKKDNFNDGEDDLLKVLYAEKVDGSSLDQTRTDVSKDAVEPSLQTDIADSDMEFALDVRTGLMVKVPKRPPSVNEEEVIKKPIEKEKEITAIEMSNMLKKAMDDLKNSHKKHTEMPLILNGMSNKRKSSEELKKPQKINNENVMDAECEIEIKKEIVSDEEESDLQYMEAKKVLFTALNISEKGTEVEKPKSNEIRTRSKTEEKGLKLKLGDKFIQLFDHTSKDSSPKLSLKPPIALKQRARKSFPSPTVYKSFNTPQKTIMKNVNITVAKTTCTTTKPTIASSDKTSPIATTSTVTSTTANQKNSTGLMILPTNPTLSYTTPISTTQLLTMMPGTTSILIQPQNQILTTSTVPMKITTTTTQTPELQPTVPMETTEINEGEMPELSLLNGMCSDTVPKAITELLCRPPPKLKPRPPGPLSTNFDEGLPSSAGPVSVQINSMAHRLTDYFRGMIVETINDVGKSDNAEALITNLRLENETLKYKHKEEILEIKKNVNSILQDIQKSILEEKERIVLDTRAACEQEALKRVEEAKSKQWCANCWKEAQFYCCWNTSYCDYPCQAKHWSKHSSKCLQQSQQPQSQVAPGGAMNKGQPIVLRPAVPPKGFPGKQIFGKAAKLIVNKNNKLPINIVRTSNQLTLVESTPGNYELVGNGHLSSDNCANLNKIINNPAVISKIKSGNVITVSSGGSGGTTAQGSSPKTFYIQTKAPPSTTTEGGKTTTYTVTTNGDRAEN